MAPSLLSGPTDRTLVENAGRRLSHDCWMGHTNDIQVTIEGTDCRSQDAPEGSDCYFSSANDYNSFRPGNVYKLVMHFQSGLESWDDDDGWSAVDSWDDDDDGQDDNHNDPRGVDIEFWEHDSAVLNPDDWCLT